MPVRFFYLLLAVFLLYSTSAEAHFGILIPSRSSVFAPGDGKINFTLAFSHPFSQEGMKMDEPREFYVLCDGERQDLRDKTRSVEFLGKPAFESEYVIRKPGVYKFGLVPAPYYEKAEDSFIIHYAKTIIGAFGDEEGWDEPMGLPMEIVPLARPFANYAGNVFTGQVLKNGKPLPKAMVEVEYFNSGSEYEAPNPYFETQVVVADSNGLFTFGIPWSGWWGFAALAEADEKMDLDGKPRKVELGGIIWVNFACPEKK